MSELSLWATFCLVLGSTICWPVTSFISWIICLKISMARWFISFSKRSMSFFNAFFAGGHLERIVLHIFASAAEDRVKQFLFGSQLALALGGHFADQDVAGTDARADADDAILIEIGQGALADVGNVAGELFAAQ